MEIGSLGELSSNRSEDSAAEKRNQRGKLLDGVDVDKVNAMFKQSVEAFEGRDEEGSSMARISDDNCRWDQWGRC